MFNLLDFFRPRPSRDNVSTLETVARMAVLAVEKPGVPGESKKAEALQIVGDLTKSMGLPVPDLLVDVAIEAAARTLHPTEKGKR